MQGQIGAESTTLLNDQTSYSAGFGTELKTPGYANRRSVPVFYDWLANSA